MKTKNQKSWVKRFEKEFGVGWNDYCSITNASGLKSFIRQELIRERKRIVEEIRMKEDKPRWGSENAEHYRTWADGYNQAVKEFNAKLKSLEEEKE